MYTEGFKPRVTTHSDFITVHMVLESIGGKKLAEGINVKGASVRRAPKEAINKNKLDWIMDVKYPMLPLNIGKEIIENLYQNPLFQHCTVIECYIFENLDWGYGGYVVVLNSHTNEYQMYFIYSNDKTHTCVCGFELMDFDCLVDQLNNFYEEEHTE